MGKKYSELNRLSKMDPESYKKYKELRQFKLDMKFLSENLIYQWFFLGKNLVFGMTSSYRSLFSSSGLRMFCIAQFYNYQSKMQSRQQCSRSNGNLYCSSWRIINYG